MAARARHRRGPRGGRVDGHRRPRAEPPRRRARRHRAARARSRRAPGLPARGRPLRRARRQAAAPDFPAAGRHQPLPAHAGRDGGLHGRPARAAQRELPRPHHRGLRSARAGRAAAAPRPAQRRRGADAARTSAGARGGAHTLAEEGVPVVTLVSDLSNSRRAGYVGLDNRAAGRTAALLLGASSARARPPSG